MADEGILVNVDDTAWRALLARAHGLDAYVKVGVLSDKGGEETEDGISLIELAALHEFGTEDGHIPERSFIRSTFETRAADELYQMQVKLSRAVVLGKLTPRIALGMLGAWAAGAIKQTITSGEGVPPPLAPSTIKAKGSSRPLVDTGQLKNSITWLVVDAEGTEAVE